MEKLYAKSAPEWTLLKTHLLHVAYAAKSLAKHLGMDEDLAYKGAILHDIGKAHPEFQMRLHQRQRSTKVFRHEISSLLFLSVFPENEFDVLIEMVAAHHKSIKNDVGEKGLLDLESGYDYEDFHVGNWKEWSKNAFDLFQELGITCSSFDEHEARENLKYSVSFCKSQVKKRGYSEWRGLLMGADHYASALINETEVKLTKAFKKPNLNFYNRTHELYPLSKKETNSPKKHTIVVASTGAGKTDYLFKRTRGRIFYALPFQASINAMFKRVVNDLNSDNPELDIRVLHASSMVVKRKGLEEETVLQPLMGSSIKILTPHQLAAIAFGMKGFEAMLLDLKNCDIILDEIHTYTGVSQSIVLKLVQVLKQINCRIHIGTATMPTILYNKIIDIIGDDVLEEKLDSDEMDKFNRHTIHKIDSFDACHIYILEAIKKKQKVLIVCNRVARAQEIFNQINEEYPDVASLLLHSRFKRGDRNDKEKQLLGLDDFGKSNLQFNTSDQACIVVSTQIVEVSLDISFDLMITETAPIDALIQRFGRVNRKRTKENIGNTKPIYILPPPNNEKEAKPYDLAVLERSFDVLPNGEVLKERELQAKIDYVYPEIDFLSIENHSVFKSDGRITIDRLTHVGKSILFELLDIDSVSCICESDVNEYENGAFEDRLSLEIPVRYYAVQNMNQSQKGNCPFVIPDKAYDKVYGLFVEKIRESNFDVNHQIL